MSVEEGPPTPRCRPRRVRLSPAPSSTRPPMHRGRAPRSHPQLPFFVLLKYQLPSFVPVDELIGDIVEVVGDNVRLRANAQNIVADTLDQRGFPARCDGAERIPGMAGGD